MPEVTICFDLTEHCLNIPLCPPIPLYPVTNKKKRGCPFGQPLFDIYRDYPLQNESYLM